MQEMTIALDHHSSSPLYEQIYRFIVSEIHAGRLEEGARLPSKRAMCAHLGVSLSTVETAYGLLLAEGYAAARPRSGFFVAASRLPRAVHPVKPSSLPVAPSAPPRFDTSTYAVDTSVFPYATWAKIFKEVLYERPDLLQRGDCRGDEELRQALCSFLYQYRGVLCTPDQIVVAAGMEHLLDMLFCLTDVSLPVAVEDPCYATPLRAALGRNRAVRLLPLDASGLKVDALSACDAALVYVTPAHQFPTGALMPVSRRMQLLSWAHERPERLIIEDDYDSEFRYSSRPMPALQGLEPVRVVYTGTFSRTIAPSIRVAYMVLPEALLPRYRERFGRSACPVSRFEQQTLARFIAGGYYARHLRRVGNLYRQRCAALSRALSNIPQVRVSASDAGLHFLVSHERLCEQEMLKRAAAQGIRLNGLSEYCHAAAPAPSTVVIGFAALNESQAEEVAALLKAAWSDSENGAV